MNILSFKSLILAFNLHIVLTTAERPSDFLSYVINIICRFYKLRTLSMSRHYVLSIIIFRHKSEALLLINHVLLNEYIIKCTLIYSIFVQALVAIFDHGVNCIQLCFMK